MPIKFHYNAVILEKYLDSFGHVNHARYLELFEEARWQIVNDRGYGLAKVQALKKGPVILDVSVKYLKELRAREKIRIESWVGEMGKATAKYYQKMYNEKHELCADAIFTFALFDMERRRMIQPTPEWLYAAGITDVKP